jgi:hypothetical protein
MNRGCGKQRVVAFVLAAMAGLLFGAGDQYLGSLTSLGTWTADVSLMSAPWLVLPFLAGSTEAAPRRAAALGLTASCAGLVGYFVMIMGPTEGGHLAFGSAEIGGLLSSNALNIAGAMTTGPLYGWLGHSWRRRRFVLSAVFLSGALLFEPVVAHLLGRAAAGEPVFVPLGEAAAGALAAGYFVFQLLRHPVASGGLGSSC